MPCVPFRLRHPHREAQHLVQFKRNLSSKGLAPGKQARLADYIEPRAAACFHFYRPRGSASTLFTYCCKKAAATSQLLWRLRPEGHGFKACLGCKVCSRTVLTY